MKKLLIGLITLSSVSAFAENFQKPRIPLDTKGLSQFQVWDQKVNSSSGTPRYFGLLPATPENAQLFCLKQGQGFTVAAHFAAVKAKCSGPNGAYCYATNRDGTLRGYVLEDLVIGKEIAIAKIYENGVKYIDVLSSVDCN